MLTLEDISRLRIGFMDIAVVETAAMDDEYQYGEFADWFLHKLI